MSANCTTLSEETFKHRVVKVLFLALIFLVAISLNVKTFLVLLKRKRHRRNVVTLFLLNLTLVSALMASQVPFNIHAAMKQGWIFGDGFCQVISSFYIICVYTLAFSNQQFLHNLRLTLAFPLPNPDEYHCPPDNDGLENYP